MTRYLGSFEEYVEARWTPLLRASVMLGCSEPEAEDLVQGVLLQAYQKWELIQRAQDPDAYVYRTLLNAFRRSRRRFWTRERPHDDTSSSFDQGSREIESSVVARVSVRIALQKLPLEQRAVVVLKYLEDRSEEDVGAILNVPVGTVKSRASRGLQRLRELLTDRTELSKSGEKR